MPSFLVKDHHHNSKNNVEIFVEQTFKIVSFRKQNIAKSWSITWVSFLFFSSVFSLESMGWCDWFTVIFLGQMKLLFFIPRIILEKTSKINPGELAFCLRKRSGFVLAGFFLRKILTCKTIYFQGTPPQEVWQELILDFRKTTILEFGKISRGWNHLQWSRKL